MFRTLTAVVVMAAASAAFIGQGAYLIRQNSTHSGDVPTDVYASVLAQSGNGNSSSAGSSSTSSKPKTPTPKTTNTPTPQPVAQPSGPVEGPCWYVFGFKQLHDLIPAIVGDCRSNEYHGGNGDGLQLTQGGLLVWRKADNWTAFTNGKTTWLLGPCGLQTRPNEGPFFSWEGRVGGPCTS